MRPVIALALLASSLCPLAAAADASCPDGADVIVNTCLDQQNAILATCTDGDWDCKCHAWQSIVQCFINCPSDPRKQTNEGQQSIFCGYASQYPSSTKAVSAGAASTAGGSKGPEQSAAAATPATTTASKQGAGSSGTPTSSPTAVAKNGAVGARERVLNVGGAIAAVAVGAIAVL
ncbi:uncharacterized protein E0L32_007110 [Thyridium curvatum]|uniref:GPI anchored serine-threonine rich protein n=1 Tax=Thyridium curvatum TaxID=1093900 RepID=A0A507B0I9_9PEZI|nr:uncharacterized protein E0L32_007110 [Thyridium curvatum]TPX12224.1 hypothetical protein E0L32_007110 [Thyridium curvatum]